MSSLLYAYQYLRRLVRECSDLRPFVLFVCVDPLSPDQQYYRYCSISVELRRWSGDGALFTRLDKYRVFFHISNCQSISSLYAYRARTLAMFKRIPVFNHYY